MTSDLMSLEEQLRQLPHIADEGFSRTVLARIADRRRRRLRILVTAWALMAVSALIVVATQLEAWSAHLRPLTAKWVTHAEQMLRQVTDESVQPPFQLLLPQQLWQQLSQQLLSQQLWQSSGMMVVAGLLAVLLTAMYVAAWE